VESEEEEEEFVNATTLDYDPFSSNANEETLEDFADSMDEEEVVEVTRTTSCEVVVETDGINETDDDADNKFENFNTM
jgi:hypothetical protein